MQKILMIIFLLALMSCNVPGRIKKNITICYDSQTIKVDSTINFCGYYRMSYVRERDERITAKGNWAHKIDTLFTNILFYNDGTIIYGFNDEDRDRDNIQAYFEELKYSKKRKSKSSINALYYGVFKICDDTIKAQFLNNPGLTNTWMAWEKWFLIKDDRIIELIAAKRLDTKASKTTLDNNLIFFERDKRLKADYVPLPYIPPQNPWIKRKTFFWCDKSEYQEFLEGPKQ